MRTDIPWVIEHLAWMRQEGIWPNGKRYLWTDAFGVVLLASLYRATGEERWLAEAKQLVADVERVLGRKRGLRIGEAADRDGQYFHYLSMWMYALYRLGEVDREQGREYRERAVALVRQVHPAFVIPGTGVWWKMEEDLSAPYPGFGLGALDAFQGYVVYRLLDPVRLETEIAQMQEIVEESWRDVVITQDLGLGMMLWMTHFFPEEPWARAQRERCLAILDQMWIDPPGYFSRQPGFPHVKFAFTNYGLSVGLQAAGTWDDRIDRLNAFFETYRSQDEYDRDAITHVMACSSHFPGELLQVFARAGSPGVEIPEGEALR